MSLPKIKLLMFLSLVLTFVSCQDLALEKQVVDRVYIIATDIPEDAMLSYKLKDGYKGFIEETVFAAGYNKSFVFAKQHPKNERTIVNYFIFSLSNVNELSPELNLRGPFDSTQFMRECGGLGITESILFQTTINSLE